MRICQFKLRMGMRGGGERVMENISKVLKAKIYTIERRTKGKEIEEIGTEEERMLATMIAHTV